MEGGEEREKARGETGDRRERERMRGMQKTRGGRHKDILV